MTKTHLECKDCGSSDALTEYDDGHTYCFSCGKRNGNNRDDPFEYSRKKKMATETKQPKPLVPKERLTLSNIRERGLARETCEKYGYYVSDTGRHIAEYRNINGEVVGQKVRRVEDKAFSINGTITDSLYGMHLWGSGKKLIITEGELDCLSYAQIIDCKYPVVSVPNGAQGAKASLLKNLDYLSKFDEIVLLFDSDEAGIKASKECASALGQMKVFIAKLPMKDANELLVNGRVKELKDAIWNACLWSPDGVVTVDDVMDELLLPVEMGIPWCFKSLNDLTRGRFLGSAIGLGAATGSGKSDLLSQQMAYDLIDLGMPVGVFSFEQRPTETIKRIASKIAGKRLHLSISEDDGKELIRYVETFKDRLYLFDSFGVSSWNKVENAIRYLNGNCNVQLFYIDNLTLLAESDGGNQKNSLEVLIKAMAMLANSLNIVIVFVSHLSTPSDGGSHEEGHRVKARDFKDSRTISHLAHTLLSMERNQQSEDEYERNTSVIRVLKERSSGDAVGHYIKVYYDRDTGLMREVSTDNSMFSIEG